MPTPAERLQVLTDQAVAAGMDDDELAQYIANIAHESSNFTRLTENLRYRGSRLMELFGPRVSSTGKPIPARNGIKTRAQWNLVALGGPTLIANTIYGGEWGLINLGNKYIGDGAKFIGRGYIQLTGRNNYTTIGRALNLDLANHPEIAADPGPAALIALYFWSTRGASAKAREGDYRGARVAINGGTLGYRSIQRIADKVSAGTFVV